MTPLLKRLETRGHVKRRRDPADERQVRIYLTEAGRKLRHRAVNIPRYILDASGLEDRQAKRLLEEISALPKALESHILFRKIRNTDPVLIGFANAARRRELVWINVTANPTAEWLARQLTEAFPWNETPRYLIRDRDQAYGAAVTRRLRAMGIRDKLRRKPLERMLP